MSSEKNSNEEAASSNGIYDRDHPKIKPFMQYLGSRPQGAADGTPFYCPDRDFSQLVSMLDSVETFICLGQAASLAKPVLSNVQKFESDEELHEATYKALEAFVKFCDDAAGIDHRKGKITVTEADDFKSFPEVEAEFLANAGPGLPYMIVLFCRAVLDRLFYAARQDRVLDNVGKLSSYETVTLSLMFSQAMRDNKTDELFDKMLRMAVTMGLANGMTGSQLSIAVDRCVVALTEKS